MNCNPFMNNREKEMLYSEKFEQTFKVSFRRFFNYVTGFDVIAFDDYLETPDGVSTKEVIEVRYGSEAAQLVENIILH